MQPDQIAGYTYRAENACPYCTIGALPTGDGDVFDGWKDCSVPPMSAEENLSELAAAFGIDRMDERTFDSGDFPKVIFASMVEDGERCTMCGTPLI
jgi:hypothetical protein